MRISQLWLNQRSVNWRRSNSCLVRFSLITTSKHPHVTLRARILLPKSQVQYILHSLRTNSVHTDSAFTSYRSRCAYKLIARILSVHGKNAGILQLWSLVRVLPSDLHVQRSYYRRIITTEKLKTKPDAPPQIHSVSVLSSHHISSWPHDSVLPCNNLCALCRGVISIDRFCRLAGRGMFSWFLKSPVVWLGGEDGGVRRGACSWLDQSETCRI